MRCIAPALFRRSAGRRAGSAAFFPVVADVAEVEASDAPVVGRMRSHPMNNKVHDFRCHDGKLWQPAYKGFWASDTPARLYATQALDWSEFNRTLLVNAGDNALLAGPYRKRPGSYEYLDASDDPAAAAVRDSILTRAANTIAIDGRPWQRSVGPLMRLNTWKRQYIRASVLNPVSTDLGHVGWKGIVRWDRWDEALDCIGAPPEDRPDLGPWGLEIREPSAFENLFDDQSVALEAFCWFHVACQNGKDLEAQGAGTVAAIAALRDGLARRHPDRAFFPMPKQLPDGWPHDEAHVFSIADPSDLAPLLEAAFDSEGDVLRDYTRAHDVLKLWSHFHRPGVDAELGALTF